MAFAEKVSMSNITFGGALVPGATARVSVSHRLGVTSGVPIPVITPLQALHLWDVPNLPSTQVGHRNGCGNQAHDMPSCSAICVKRGFSSLNGGKSSLMVAD